MSNTASAVAAGSTVANLTAFDRGRDEALEEARLPIDHRAAQGLTLLRRADLAADLVDVHPEEVLMLLEELTPCGDERRNRRLQRAGRLDAVAYDASSSSMQARSVAS